MTFPTPDPAVPSPTSDPASPPPGATPQPPSGDPTPGSKDWENSYKGLQSSTDKKIAELQAQIVALQTRYNTLNTDHETLKRTHTELSGSKTVLETSESALREQLKTVIAEKDRLATTQRQQTLILRDYPQLAQFVAFIPPADTDDAYLANAKAFSETLKNYVDLGVRTVVAGASPPGPVQTPDTRNVSTEDLAWTKVSALAGIPGKEAEYEIALDEWTKLKTQQAR